MGYYAHMLIILINSFLSKVNYISKCVFSIESEHCAVCNYLGQNISLSDSEMMIDQVNCVKSVDYLIVCSYHVT